jgi:tRNA nucleotidyltransferase (CCA-adding enzyme)
LPAVVTRTLRKLETVIRRDQQLATVALGGSTAKGTYLRNDHDIDVFVRFATSYADDELAEHLERAIKRAFGTTERVHGSRDYFHVQREGYTFEFVPVLRIDSWQEARNVTDMSPLHVAYVRRRIDERPWLAQEIRLTKQFCKAAKVYGAESYIGGLSGHVIDLLIIQHGGFRKLLEAAASWPAKVVLDPESRLDSPMTQMDNAKTAAPLVIVDPVQQDRNSAAAVTKEAFQRFREAARAYLSADPRAQAAFFTIIPLNIARFRKEHADAAIIVVELVPPAGKKDVVGAKCRKVHEHIVRGLLDAGFRIITSAWEFTPKRATLLFALPKEPLPAQEEITGPPMHKTRDVARFTAAHKATFTRDGRVYAMERRRNRAPQPLVKALLKQRYAQERVKGARCR